MVRKNLLNSKYLVRILFAIAVTLGASYLLLLVSRDLHGHQKHHQLGFQWDGGGRGRKFKVRPPAEAVVPDLRGLERLVNEGEDGEGVDFEVVLEEMEEERKKFSKQGAKEKDGGISSSVPAGAGEGSNKRKTKHILYWNSAYGSRRYGFCCGSDPFVQHGCPVSDCAATDNRSALGSVADFDAVVFHLRNLHEDDLPERRAAEQRYVMFMLESPAYMMGQESSVWNDFFNWTLTYRLDSDFPMPYGRIARTREHTDDPEELNKLIRDFGKANRHLAKKKKNRAAWFVSNCESMSLRERYVATLSRHFDVDIYGACGNHSCSKDRNEACWSMVDRDYKFYLSFENSICGDYATEKFFNVVSKTRSVLPVALGGADYAALGAPPRSHLSVHDREEWERDPAALARELRRLSSDDAAFAEYFWWRDYYEVRQGKEHLERPFCELCAALHDKRRPPKVYEDLEEWWEGKARCRRLRKNYSRYPQR